MYCTEPNKLIILNIRYIIHIIGRDMKRPDKGTWIGISRDGKFSTVTNYRKEYNAPFVPYRSKGKFISVHIRVCYYIY